MGMAIGGFAVEDDEWRSKVRRLSEAKQVHPEGIIKRRDHKAEHGANG